MKTNAFFPSVMSALVLLTACSKEEAVTPHQTAQGANKIEESRDLPCPDAGALLFNRTWTLKTLERRHIYIRPGSASPWITFGHRHSQEMVGFGICNDIRARFTISCEVLHFLDVGATRMYCAFGQPLEQQFVTNLKKTNRFAVDRETLTLYDGNTELATFFSDRTLLAPAIAE